MFSAIIAQLEQAATQIEASGPVAAVAARIDISTHSKSGYEYARLRSDSSLKACGRVGSEKHLEALATLHRRDKIAQVKRAIESLRRADEILIVSGPSQGLTTATGDNTTQLVTAQPGNEPATTTRKKKAKGRKQLYTHVKTRQGSLIHAVLGKDKVGEWRTAALCGATPPQRDRMGWEFPIHDDGVSCPKCYRKLPANGKRHFPDFG